MESSRVKWSLAGASIGALLFVLLGFYLNSAIGSGLLDHPGPRGFLALIGATVGGLVAPLFRRRKEEDG